MIRERTEQRIQDEDFPSVLVNEFEKAVFTGAMSIQFKHLRLMLMRTINLRTVILAHVL
jgi:hypothetical protein